MHNQFLNYPNQQFINETPLKNYQTPNQNQNLDLNLLQNNMSLNFQTPVQQQYNQPNLLNAQPNLFNAHPNLLNAQPNLLNAQPNLLNAQSNLLNAQPNLLNAEPTIANPQVQTQNMFLQNMIQMLQSQLMQNMLGNQPQNYQTNQSFPTPQLNPQVNQFNDPEFSTFSKTQQFEFGNQLQVPQIQQTRGRKENWNSQEIDFQQNYSNQFQQNQSGIKQTPRLLPSQQSNQHFQLHNNYSDVALPQKSELLNYNPSNTNFQEADQKDFLDDSQMIHHHEQEYSQQQNNNNNNMQQSRKRFYQQQLFDQFQEETKQETNFNSKQQLRRQLIPSPESQNSQKYSQQYDEQMIQSEQNYTDQLPIYQQDDRPLKPLIENRFNQYEEENNQEEIYSQRERANSFDEMPIKGQAALTFEEMLEQKLGKKETQIQQSQLETPEQQQKQQQQQPQRQTKKPFLKKRNQESQKKKVQNLSQNNEIDENSITISITPKNKEQVQTAQKLQENQKRQKKYQRSLIEKQSSFTEEQKTSQQNSRNQSKEEIKEKKQQQKKFLQRGQGRGGGKGTKNFNNNNDSQIMTPLKTPRKEIPKTADKANIQSKTAAQKSQNKLSPFTVSENKISYARIKFDEDQSSENQKQLNNNEQNDDNNAIISSSQDQSNEYQLKSENQEVQAFVVQNRRSASENQIPYLSVNQNQKPKLQQYEEEEQQQQDDDNLNKEIQKYTLENERAQKVRQKYENLLRQLHNDIESFKVIFEFKTFVGVQNQIIKSF